MPGKELVKIRTKLNVFLMPALAAGADWGDEGITLEELTNENQRRQEKLNPRSAAGTGLVVMNRALKTAARKFAGKQANEMDVDVVVMTV